jgi:hypothetical protein
MYRPTNTNHYNIKAIPTFYKGIQYRSKLEAKWALFFHLLNIPFEYEPQAFQLGKVGYLPDFYIPKWNNLTDFETFIEIKPRMRKAPYIWRSKCNELASKHQKITMLFTGDPSNHSIYLFGFSKELSRRKGTFKELQGMLCIQTPGLNMGLKKIENAHLQTIQALVKSHKF